MITEIPGWNNLSATELLAFTQEHPETRRPIPVGDLQFFLQDKRIAWLGLSGGWEGPLVELIPSLPTDIQEGVALMLAHIRNHRSEKVDTTDPRYSPLLPAIIAVAGVDAAEVYAMGGGRRYPAFTDAAEAEAAKADAMHAARITNATALFAERMQPGDDPAVVMAKAWEDAA